MGHDVGNRVLHDTENSVARDLETQQITAGLPDLVKALFRRGLRPLLNSSRPIKRPG
jgi:hypothetical protein